MDGSFNLAVHALVCLSHSGRSLSSEALAENICCLLYTSPIRAFDRVRGIDQTADFLTLPMPNIHFPTTLFPRILSEYEVQSR